MFVFFGYPILHQKILPFIHFNYYFFQVFLIPLRIGRGADSFIFVSSLHLQWYFQCLLNCSFNLWHSLHRYVINKYTHRHWAQFKMNFYLITSSHLSIYNNMNFYWLITTDVVFRKGLIETQVRFYSIQYLGVASS